MSIFSRLADIINSNLTALLDKAEDPQKMVRLIIQEMEDELVKERSNLARFLASQKEIGRQVARHQERVDEWQAKAELALTKGREDLARAALVEKKKQTELSETLYREQQAVDSGIEKLGEEIRQLEAKLEDARARQKAMAIRSEAASSRLNVQSQVARGDSQAVVSKFERIETSHRRNGSARRSGPVRQGAGAAVCRAGSGRPDQPRAGSDAPEAGSE